jgi:hypothetical protein
MFEPKTIEPIGPNVAGSMLPSSLPVRFQAFSEQTLLSFFLGHTDEERTARFGGAVSDYAIRAWRHGIDRGHYFAVGREQGRQIIGLAELFGCGVTGWKQPELALSIRDRCNTAAVRLQLMEFGLIAARERGAADVFMCFNCGHGSMHGLVRQYGGTIDYEAGNYVIPCVFVSSDASSLWPETL